LKMCVSSSSTFRARKGNKEELDIIMGDLTCGEAQRLDLYYKIQSDRKKY